MMTHIRRAEEQDASRIAEIEIFNYRLQFYPIFQSDVFYFEELQVVPAAEKLKAAPQVLANTWVYDDGVVKGFLRLEGKQVKKLFVEPVLQGRGIGAALLGFALGQGADHLWALEKNTRAIAFYRRHGFVLTGEKQSEEGTEEFLVKMERK